MRGCFVTIIMLATIAILAAAAGCGWTVAEIAVRAVL